MSGGKRVDFTRESGLNTESATSVRSLLMSARTVVGSMVAALWMRLSGLFASASSIRLFLAGRAWPDKMGSVDEPLGSPEGIPPWVIALLVLLLVAAIIVLAILFLVPPGPPPYT